VMEWNGIGITMRSVGCRYLLVCYCVWEAGSRRRSPLKKMMMACVWFSCRFDSEEGGPKTKARGGEATARRHAGCMTY
jgi:hypothetical protein